MGEDQRGNEEWNEVEHGNGSFINPLRWNKKEESHSKNRPVFKNPEILLELPVLIPTVSSRLTNAPFKKS
jgi:hypothetical protein